MMLKNISSRLRNGSIESRLVSGLAAYGSGDLAVRFIHLGTTLVLGHQLDAAMIGQAAIALTLFELIRVLARNGIGQAIILSSASNLEKTCNRAHILFWRTAWLLMLLHFGAAAILAWLFDQPAAGAMLAMLSLVYTMMLGGLVQVHLAMREGRTAACARTTSLQTAADHILTAALLLAWPSPWALVLPKLLTTRSGWCSPAAHARGVPTELSPRNRSPGC